MNLDVNFMVKHIPDFVKATKLTLSIATIGVIISIFLGLICCLFIYYDTKFFSKIAKGYIEVSRNTPLLIQLFFLYYGFPQIGIVIEPFTCGVIGLSFLGGGYMAEAFRSGLMSIEKIQIQSGMSLGFTNAQLMRYIILPQAFSISVPQIGANIIFLIKETSVFSAIALGDLMFVAKDLIGMYYKTSEAFTMLVISYLIILVPLTIILTWLERKVRYAEFGN